MLVLKYIITVWAAVLIIIAMLLLFTGFVLLHPVVWLGLFILAGTGGGWIAYVMNEE